MYAFKSFDNREKKVLLPIMNPQLCLLCDRVMEVFSQECMTFVPIHNTFVCKHFPISVSTWIRPLLELFSYGHYYGVIFVFLPTLVYCMPSPQCDSIWRWTLWEKRMVRWDHEAGALMTELVPLSEEEERYELFLSLSLSLPCENTRSLVRNPESGFSPGTKWAGTMILDLPACRTVTSKCLLSTPSSYVICYRLLC